MEGIIELTERLTEIAKAIKMQNHFAEGYLADSNTEFASGLKLRETLIRKADECRLTAKMGVELFKETLAQLNELAQKLK